MANFLIPVDEFFMSKQNPFLIEHLRCPFHTDAFLLKQTETSDSNAQFQCSTCGRMFCLSEDIFEMFSADDYPELAEFLKVEEQQWDACATEYDTRREKCLSYMNGVYAGVSRIGSMIQTNQTVLDVGCGTGLGTRQMHREGLQTVAMDISRQSLGFLKQKISIPGLSLVQACLPRIPFRDDCFDYLICANTLQHLPSEQLRQETVCHIARVLKPNGTAVITVYNFSPQIKRLGWKKEGESGSYSGKVQYIFRFEIEEFKKLLKPYFSKITITGSGFPLIYQWKLSPISVFFERAVFQKLQCCVNWGDMYVAVCKK